MKRVIFTLCALLCAPFAFAAGENKTLKRTIDETQLAGYLPAPPTGWARNFVYGPATASSASVQKIYAVYNPLPTALPNVPPPPTALTLIALSGAILSRETFPDAVQTTNADCIDLPQFPPSPPVRSCGRLFVSIVPSKILPGRLIFNVVKVKPLNSFLSRATYYTLIFDPSAPVSSPGDRWFIAENKTVDAGGTGPGGSGTFFTFDSADRLTPTHPAVETNFFVFRRLSATQTAVYQVTAK